MKKLINYSIVVNVIGQVLVFIFHKDPAGTYTELTIGNQINDFLTISLITFITGLILILYSGNKNGNKNKKVEPLKTIIETTGIVCIVPIMFLFMLFPFREEYVSELFSSWILIILLLLLLIDGLILGLYETVQKK